MLTQFNYLRNEAEQKEKGLLFERMALRLKEICEVLNKVREIFEIKALNSFDPKKQMKNEFGTEEQFKLDSDVNIVSKKVNR